MKRILSTFCASIMTLLVFAQIPFEVEIPEWTHIAVPNTDGGVNIRKFPSTSAPRPMINEDKIEYYDIPAIYNAYWSTATPKGNTYPLMFTESAPIIKEDNGWYELKGIGAQGENGWVSAKYCKRISPEPITLNYLLNNEFLKDHVKVFNNDGEAYILIMNTNEMDQDITFILGKLVNGMIVFPYELYAGYEPGKSVKLEKNDGYKFIYSEKDYDAYEEPDFRGVTDSVLNDILVNLKKASSPTIWYKVNGYIETIQ